MPDSRKHRGPHPQDCNLFGESARAGLVQAGHDYAWLLSRCYPADASLKLVGDQHQLTARQRLAVRRSVCSNTQWETRQQKKCTPPSVRDQCLAIDAFNVLTTVEAALSGGVLLEAQDECWRDMASMHGTYRRVAETEPAIDRVGQTLASLGPQRCHWLIDKPVSNSGRLRAMLVDTAENHGWNWTVELVPDPDPILTASSDVVCSADSMILDGCARWFNLAREVLEDDRDQWWVVSFS